MKNKFYSLVVLDREASINIYGDITSWEWLESDVSSYTLSKQLEGLDVDIINVFINSYGGEVAEGLAIYNSLKRHKAKIKTYCDGFAASIASVIFMAGEERIMSNASLLFVHNAWTNTAGNANELRKQADDLEAITQASINAYLSGVTITEEELKTLLDAETWLSPQKALEMGFATTVVNDDANSKANQSIKKKIIDQFLSVKVLEQETPKEIIIEEVEPEPSEPVPTEPEEKVTETIEENKIQKLMAALCR